VPMPMPMPVRRLPRMMMMAMPTLPAGLVQICSGSSIQARLPGKLSATIREHLHGEHAVLLVHGHDVCLVRRAELLGQDREEVHHVRVCLLLRFLELCSEDVVKSQRRLCLILPNLR